jgi:hypothetical protein
MCNTTLVTANNTNNTSNNNSKNSNPVSMTKHEHFLAAKNNGGIHNLTPHAITVAGVTYEPSGIVARVETDHTEIVDGLCSVKHGQVKFFKNNEEFVMTGYEIEGTVNIVSAMVFEVTKDWTVGVWVAPATGHPDVVRNEKGHIVSVPAFLI